MERQWPSTIESAGNVMQRSIRRTTREGLKSAAIFPYDRALLSDLRPSLPEPRYKPGASHQSGMAEQNVGGRVRLTLALLPIVLTVVSVRALGMGSERPAWSQESGRLGWDSTR